MTAYSKIVEVRWSDLDANQHMRHSAYADLCAHVRTEWLQDCGFSAAEFAQQGFGPILFSESTEYRREVGLCERLSINVIRAAASPDCGRWRIRQEMFKADGTLAAIHEVSGAWMDLKQRKLIPPPQRLLDIMNALPGSDDFATLPQPAYR